MVENDGSFEISVFTDARNQFKHTYYTALGFHVIYAKKYLVFSVLGHFKRHR